MIYEDLQSPGTEVQVQQKTFTLTGVQVQAQEVMPRAQVQKSKPRSPSPEIQNTWTSGLSFLDFWIVVSGLTPRTPRAYSGSVLCPVSARAHQGQISGSFVLSLSPSPESPSSESPSPERQNPILASPGSDVQSQSSANTIPGGPIPDKGLRRSPVQLHRRHSMACC